MGQTVENGVQSGSAGQDQDRPLSERIARAVESRATPISQLLRLMSALDAEESANENLRLRLRARIGAPLGA